VLVRHDLFREVLAALIDAQARLQCQVIKAVMVCEVALLYSDFDGMRVEESGEMVAFSSRAIEVLHCQEDGTWTLIVGDPNGREEHRIARPEASREHVFDADLS
jgi:hypothetical protein